MATSHNSKPLKASISNTYFSNLTAILSATGSQVYNLTPARIATIKNRLQRSKDTCERYAIALETLADILEQNQTIESLSDSINELVLILEGCLKTSEDNFYEKGGEVEFARTNLYALKSGVQHGQGNSLDVFAVDPNKFLRGSETYWTRLEDLLRSKHEAFLKEDRKRPTYIATTWPMESSYEVRAMSQLGKEILMISIHTLPHFEADEKDMTDDLQLKYLANDPVHGTNSANAFAVVINSCGSLPGVKRGSTPSSKPLPVAVHLSFAARMAAGEIGSNLSGNEGLGLLIEGAKDAQVYRYRNSDSSLRNQLMKLGVLTLTRHKIRGNVTTCVGGDKPAYENYSAMDAYTAICRSIEQHVIDKIDSTWTDKSEEKLREQLKHYFNDLFSPGPKVGRKVLKKPVRVDEEVEIEYDESTGSLTIYAPIHLPGVLNGASITVDPVISKSQNPDEE